MYINTPYHTFKIRQGARRNTHGRSSCEEQQQQQAQEEDSATPPASAATPDVDGLFASIYPALPEEDGLKASRNERLSKGYRSITLTYGEISGRGVSCVQSLLQRDDNVKVELGTCLIHGQEAGSSGKWVGDVDTIFDGRREVMFRSARSEVQEDPLPAVGHNRRTCVYRTCSALCAEESCCLLASGNNCVPQLRNIA